MSFTFNVRGIREFAAKLESQKKGLVEKVDNELDASAQNIAQHAKTLAPVFYDSHGGNLRQTIQPNVSHKLSKTVDVHAEYAAYIEFGTGQFAAAYVPTLPEEIQEYARTFYVNGLGRTRQQPFLFPAFEAEIPKLIERLSKVLLS